MMDGDWPGEVTKLQLENNSTDPNHITVSHHIIVLFFYFSSFCISVFYHLKIGRFLAVEKISSQVGLGYILQLYKVRSTNRLSPSDRRAGD